MGSRLAIAGAIVLSTVAADAQAAGCTSKEIRQFDFWVGKWNVFRKTNLQQQVATSLIENLYNGCGIRENWMPFKGSPGGSLNTFNPLAHRWEQFWVDGDASLAHFTGGWNGKAMVIQGVWPQPGHSTQITRIAYTPIDGGHVEQAGMSSDDSGKTWQPSFDLIYVRQ